MEEKKITVEMVVKVVALVAAVVGALAVNVWALPCQKLLELTSGNMVPMRCLYTEKIATLLFIVVAIVAIWTLVTKKKASLLVVILGLSLILVTFESIVGIGVCKSAMMCWIMATWIRVCGGVIIVCGVVELAMAAGKRQVQ